MNKEISLFRGARGFTLQNFLKNLGGFTLIEMLVVIAIIGILSSVLLTALGPARSKARDTRIIQELNQVRAFASIFERNSSFDGLPDVNGASDIPSITDDNLRILAQDILAQGGELFMRRTTVANSDGYIIYSPLNLPGGDSVAPQKNYFCADSEGRAVYTTNESALSIGEQCPIPQF